MDLLDPENNLYFLVHHLDLMFSAIFRASFAKAGLKEIKPAYLGVLLLLWRESGIDEALGKLGSPGGMKMSELGRYIGLEPSTMTGLIDRMERDGLVYREDDPDDRRSQLVCISDKGMRARKDVLVAIKTALRGAFAGVDEAELEQCRRILQNILKNSDEMINHEK